MLLKQTRINDNKKVAMKTSRRCRVDVNDTISEFWAWVNPK